MEQTIITCHCSLVEDRVQWRFDPVLKSETVPAQFTMRVLQDASIEASKDVWMVVLRIGSPNSRLEVRGKVMPIQADGGLGQTRTTVSH